MMVFEQLNLNVNSRALTKLLTNNPEQPDTSISSDKLTESLWPYIISEGDWGEYGNLSPYIWEDNSVLVTMLVTSDTMVQIQTGSNCEPDCRPDHMGPNHSLVPVWFRGQFGPSSVLCHSSNQTKLLNHWTNVVVVGKAGEGRFLNVHIQIVFWCIDIKSMYTGTYCWGVPKKK